jgi:hypothetical protein
VTGHEETAIRQQGIANVLLAHARACLAIYLLNLDHSPANQAACYFI